MRHLNIGLYILVTSTIFSSTISAQQYIGLDTRSYSAIQHIPNNPAWVTSSKTGMEVMLGSASLLAGTNAYSFSKGFVFRGFDSAAIEGKNYERDITRYPKHLWANAEFNGPSISYQYKNEHYIGIYTRARQIYRAGGIASTELQLIGQDAPELFLGDTIDFNKAGFVAHSFSEVGFTYGRILHDDYYNILKAGVTLKYLMGFAAGSVYSESLGYSPDSLAGVRSATGDLNILYTYNISPLIDPNVQNDATPLQQRAGRGSLGLDLGFQFEYHPNGNPNKKTPYLFSVAASITDIGSVRYIADTGSGTYYLGIENKNTFNYTQWEYEPLNKYLVRIDKDTLLGASDKISKFNIGLPTAFRFNADYNSSEHFNLAINMLLNLRGNSKLNYRPAYVNYFNLTPSYYGKNIRMGLPFTIIGYQTITAGVNFQIGPFYMGSSNAFSMLMFNKFRSFDAYAGLVWKFKDRTKRRY